ncbi:uncharacterized protein LOC103713247 [Phoenix dactylifera]|uniref:procollagen-proline 3-dioxygenase n=1 Tax=Phoenix dactylifera TaxID=42345 RepID=A0A8B7CFP4_PHODC|nr:uncharacterized protein LOC103713247 [Phoenix dactylifera]
MAAAEHPRLLLPQFLSPDLCKELEFIHRSCGTVGYRPNVFSTTLSHLIATNCAHLILPFLSTRERLKEKVEEFFGCEFELFIEFTGLISWCKGAYIGWHSDDNRPYLKQRDFAAVCYLNSHGKDFRGGIFHFKEGEPSSLVPVAGDVVIYTADNRNIHSVDEVIDGERLTLTLWFSRDSAHDEDAKLIALLSQILLSQEDDECNSNLPLPASDNMYWFPHGESGFDIRCARLQILGFSFYSSNDGKYNISNTSHDPLELLVKPLQIGRGNEIFEKEFINSLHALQVVQFYYWKAPELATERRETGTAMGSAQHSLIEKSSNLELVLPCNNELAETVLGRISYDDANLSFDWSDFALAVIRWEDYICRLCGDLSILMPHWLAQRTVFFVNPAELKK